MNSWICCSNHEVNPGLTFKGRAEELVPKEDIMYFNDDYARLTAIKLKLLDSYEKPKQEDDEVEPPETFIYSGGRGPTSSCWPDTECCIAAQKMHTVDQRWTIPFDFPNAEEATSADAVTVIFRAANSLARAPDKIIFK